MANTNNTQKDYYVIDVMHILKSIWYRIWIVALVGILAAATGFSLAKFAIKPTYSSSIMLYINNSSISLNDVGFSISSSDLTAAQSLVKTYSVLLKNRTTLERVIEETGVVDKETGLPYTWEQVDDMIEASSVDETEVMRVTVTTINPYEAETIANGIAKVLPQRVAEVVEGTSMEVVDSAVPNLQKVAPSISRYTVVGFILGVLLSALILAIRALLDNTIQDEDYIIHNYNYPILAKIPNLLDMGTKKYGYRYYRKGQNSEEVN